MGLSHLGCPLDPTKYRKTFPTVFGISSDVDPSNLLFKLYCRLTKALGLNRYLLMTKLEFGLKKIAKLTKCYNFVAEVLIEWIDQLQKKY